MSVSKSRYVPALDGLRAIAVIAVIAYHMNMPWARGGLLGVTIFFVLSGYLITSLLLAEWNTTHHINLPQFWLRRIRRLFPAIVLVIVVMASLFTFFDHSLLTKLRTDMWAALLWVTNWWYIFHDASYFEALGAPSPLIHFWSLAIEEQFYLIWPILLFGAHKAGIKQTTMRNITLVLALLSAGEMALLYNPTADPSRVYYGTDTRAFSLLMGAWLAFVWPLGSLGAKHGTKINKGMRTALDGIGVAAGAGLVAMVFCVDGLSPFWYWGGTLLASVLTTILIAVLVCPKSRVGCVLSTKCLVWIGLRSYGMYLWHFPLLLLMNPRNFTGDISWYTYVGEIVVIVVCAALSYHLVEDPIRHGAIGRLITDLREDKLDKIAWLRKWGVTCSAATVALFVAIGGLIVIPPTSALEGGYLLQDETAQTAGIPQSVSLEKASSQPPLDIIMIGDSVSVRTIPYFEKTFPYGAIDAAVNRQLYIGQDVYTGYKQQGIIGNIVVFALGTNGVATDEQLDELIGAVDGKKHIFLVNTRSPQPWVDETNAALQSAAERYANVDLIDWYAKSANQDNYFDGDGTHLSEEGAQVYIDMIQRAVRAYLPVHSENDRTTCVKTPFESTADNAVIAVKNAVITLACHTLP